MILRSKINYFLKNILQNKRLNLVGTVWTSLLERRKCALVKIIPTLRKNKPTLRKSKPTLVFLRVGLDFTRAALVYTRAALVFVSHSLEVLLPERVDIVTGAEDVGEGAVP